ncbi:DNA binding domain protein, excisionase family [Cyanobacterium stanieri PCC 7202]|uniref:DNA binding domain protein, excisionase family n=1 Tax=Cyanobacterium stanieri (strain ATCC 29140 / PCC 7202) TaxID=292563 RepID=K9YN07_CYASC|nr:DNA binding domain protein, excisionase family [Cyanobacterium stanieri PCC 7202]
MPFTKRAEQGKNKLVKKEKHNINEPDLELQKDSQSVIVICRDEYMTIGETADFLNVSPSYLNQILKNRELSYIKIGKRRKIKTKDVVQYQQIRDKKRNRLLNSFSQGLKEDGLYEYA